MLEYEENAVEEFESATNITAEHRETRERVRDNNNNSFSHPIGI